MPRRVKRPRGRQIQAARMYAEGGRTQQQVAEELGIGVGAVSKAVNAVLNYEAFEDIRNCRLLANRRLDSLRAGLLEAAGLGDPEGPMTKAKYRQRKNKTPPTVAELARVVGVLVAIEKRRAEMFGFDAPRHIAIGPADPLASMTPEELIVACQSENITVPPGLREEVERRRQRDLRPAEIASGDQRQT